MSPRIPRGLPMSPSTGRCGPAHRARRRPRGVAGLVGIILLSACAQGTSDDQTDAQYDADASLSGLDARAGLRRVSMRSPPCGWTGRRRRSADVEVKLIEGDLDIQQFLSSVATGDPPDDRLRRPQPDRHLRLPRRDHPADDCIEGEGIDIEPFSEAALDQVTFDDEVYGIPEFNIGPDRPGQQPPARPGRADHRGGQRLRLGGARRRPTRR